MVVTHDLIPTCLWLSSRWDRNHTQSWRRQLIQIESVFFPFKRGHEGEAEKREDAIFRPCFYAARGESRRRTECEWSHVIIHHKSVLWFPLWYFIPRDFWKSATSISKQLKKGCFPRAAVSSDEPAAAARIPAKFNGGGNIQVWKHHRRRPSPLLMQSISVFLRFGLQSVNVSEEGGERMERNCFKVSEGQKDNRLIKMSPSKKKRREGGRMRTDVSAGELILLPPDVNELTPPYATATMLRREFTPAKVTH